MAGVERKKRLADYGLHSERTLMRKKGPGVFDIEIVFLYPVAVILEQVRWFAVAELGFFIAILAVAYVYVWKKGALEWRR